jgi:uncharacterized protein (TIGR00369 family)
MTETAHSVTLDRARSVRSRINAHLVQEARDLGADPTILAQQALTMSGLEFFQRWLRYDDLPPPPPIALLFCMEWVEVEPSRAVLALEAAEWMFGPSGAVYGGVAATLVDTVLGAAVQTTLPAGTGYATTDLHMRFIRAMNADTGRVIATGTVVHAGRRHAIAEGRVEVEATGKLMATGTADCPIIRPS